MTFEDSFRSWRRDLKARMPYVRRREFAILQRKYNELADGLGWAASPADSARLQAIKPIAGPLVGEVCLFVTHAATPRMKPHVLLHVEHLIRAGVQVVLILNTDLAVADFAFEPAWTEKLAGIYVRENLGFDFAAWAHLFSICDRERWSRLYVVNDSIVGPLSGDDFARVLERIRNSPADLVGLTESQHPLPHLQSFFLAFNAPALHGPVVQGFFSRVLNLPTKAQVIDVYETRMTRELVRQGLRHEALFAPLSNDRHAANDTFFRWDRLLDAGFPYVKASVLLEFANSAAVRARVPAELLPPRR